MTADYAAWLRAVFDHPPTEPSWYWAEGFDSAWGALGLSDEVVVRYLTALFRDPSPLAAYSLPQVAQGIWLLVGESSPAQVSHALIRPPAALEARVRCVKAIAEFFRLFVDPSARGAPYQETDPFHLACYMWWDVFPTWGRADVAEPEINRACLQAMQDMLECEAELCRLSALHGLNHWHLHHPREVEDAIDDFIARNPGLSTWLREYAEVARHGCAQ